MDEPRIVDSNAFYKFAQFFADIVEKPVIWFHETVVLPNRKEYPWYHEKVRRVPTVDECFTDDYVCIFEADEQFRRDRMIDGNILKILRRRYESCYAYERPDHKTRCRPLYDTYMNATTNFFIKYGDLHSPGRAYDAYMKQKHRMIWERRHGPVGSGMKSDKEQAHAHETKREKC